MEHDRKDHGFVPQDYAEMWEHYFATPDSLAQTLIRSMVPFEGDNESDLRRDLLQDAAARMVEHHMIERFDSNKSNFGGMVFVTVRTVCANHWNKRTRNPLSGLSDGTIQETSGEDEVFEPGVYALDKVFAVDESARLNEAIDAKYAVDALLQIARHVMESGRGNKRDRSTYPMLQLMLEGADEEDCAKALGVTRGTIKNWLAYAKQLFQQATMQAQAL